MKKEEFREQDPLDDAPLLRSLKNAPDPFVVPDGFFDRFPHQVQERVVKRHSVAKASWPVRLAISIGVVALFIAVWWALPQTDGTETIPAGEELVLDVAPQELPVDETMVWEVYADAGEPLFSEVLLELEEHELYAYLEYENVDVELLMEEL